MDPWKEDYSLGRDFGIIYFLLGFLLRVNTHHHMLAFTTRIINKALMHIELEYETIKKILYVVVRLWSNLSQNGFNWEKDNNFRSPFLFNSKTYLKMWAAGFQLTFHSTNIVFFLCTYRLVH